MNCTDFASPSGGFNRNEPHLAESLSFSALISDTISNWPEERDEIRRRLHKMQKEAIPFNYDTTPQVGIAAAQIPESKADREGRVYVELAFVDCWADLMLGAGWTDREERTFKQSNWALVSAATSDVTIDM
jgi:hypothetical protein